jgi:hypothetical protein
MLCENTPVKTLGKYSLYVYWDDEPYDPREDDHLGTMACFHRRKCFGDKGHGIDSDHFGGWDEMEAYIRKELKAVVVLPIYLYSHSGDTIATTPFSCPWDSGQIGFIYCTKADIRENWVIKRVTEHYIARAEEVLEGEVKDYDHYVSGDQYRWWILDENDEYVESAHGYDTDEEAEQDGLNILEGYHENAERIRIEQQQHVLYLRSQDEGDGGSVPVDS